MVWIPIAKYDFAESGLTDLVGLGGTPSLEGGATLGPTGLSFDAAGALVRLPPPLLWTGSVLGEVSFRIPQIADDQRYNIIEAGNAFAVFVDANRVARATFRHPSGAWVGTHVVDEPLEAGPWHTLKWRLGTGAAYIRVDEGQTWKVPVAGPVPHPPKDGTAKGTLIGAWPGNLQGYPLQGQVRSLSMFVELPEPPPHDEEDPRDEVREHDWIAAANGRSRPRGGGLPADEVFGELSRLLSGGGLALSDSTLEGTRRLLASSRGVRVRPYLRRPHARGSRDAGRELASMVLESASASSRRTISAGVELVYERTQTSAVLEVVPLVAGLMAGLRDQLDGGQGHA